MVHDLDHVRYLMGLIPEVPTLKPSYNRVYCAVAALGMLANNREIYATFNDLALVTELSYETVRGALKALHRNKLVAKVEHEAGSNRGWRLRWACQSEAENARQPPADPCRMRSRQNLAAMRSRSTPPPNRRQEAR